MISAIWKCQQNHTITGIQLKTVLCNLITPLFVMFGYLLFPVSDAKEAIIS